MRWLVPCLFILGCGSGAKEEVSDGPVSDGVSNSPGDTTGGDSAPVDTGGGEDSSAPIEDTGTPPDTGDEPDTGDGDDTGSGGDDYIEPTGFIGSTCSSDADCDYDGGVCLTDGFPGGMCSSECDLYCPDAEGHPVTFCVDGADILDGSLEGGWCVSRCDFGVHPDMGCRDDYGCRIESRHSEPWTETYACLPGDETDLSSCHFELADRGIAFEPTIRAVDHPEERPDIDCVIEDPVWILSPVFGVDLKYYDGSPTPRTLAACNLAHAVADTVEDVVDSGVSSILHVGTYNCRMIGGTDSLSRHGYADAIDIYGFEFEAGHTWTLIDHWEHDTTAPSTEAGRFLYEAAYRWYDDWIWTIILTPNYNLAHDNHFHVDLTPGSHFIEFTDGRYIGPALYVD